MNITFCDYFGGISAVKKKIAQAIQNERRARGLSTDEIDRFFDFTNASAKYPRCKEIEDNPEKVNSNTASMMLNGLGVMLQDVFDVEAVVKNPENIKKIMAEMKRVGAGLVGGGPPGTTPESQVPLMIIIGLQSELDQHLLPKKLR